MIAVVTGGRIFQLTDLGRRELDKLIRLFRIHTVRHGGARGIDSDVHDHLVAHHKEVLIEVHPYKSRLGKFGGHARNREMLVGPPIANLCIAFAGERGTSDCWDTAMRLNIDIEWPTQACVEVRR
jgi:hypothetical protein